MAITRSAIRASALRRFRWFAAPLFALLYFAASAQTAVAHWPPLDRPVVWTDWNWDPAVLLALGSITWLYCLGLRRLWKRAGIRRVIGRGHAIAFAAGMAVLLVALISPLDPLGEQLSAAHMVQHMLLMTVAAPLIAFGAPSLVVLWGLSRHSRHTVGWLWRHVVVWRIGTRWLRQPLVPWFLYALVMWAWHVPAFYGASLRNPFVHDVQHITFFVAAYWFWRVLLDPVGRFRIAGPLAVIYLFTTTLHATILGALMTLSETPWYLDYEGRTSLWALTPLEDQQLAGLIMWMPACLPYLVVAVALIARTLTRLDLGFEDAARARELYRGSPG